MSDVWFHWERNATFTSLYMCMDAWGIPTKRYYGVAWPTTICIWKNDVIAWDTKNDELADMGKGIVDNFLQNGWAGFEIEIGACAKRMDAFINQCESTDFSRVNNEDLVRTFGHLSELYTEWFVLGTTEPVGIYGEKVIEKLANDKKKFSILTSPLKKSFSRRQFEDLLMAKSEKDLDAHAKKYFWLHNSYFSTETLGKDFFEEELQKAREKYPDAAQYVRDAEQKDSELAIEKEKIMNELNFDEKQRKLVGLMEFFAWFQDYRKEYIMRMLHYLDKMLEEIGRRKGLTLGEMKYVLPEEILKNSLDKQVVRKRMRHCMVVWDREKEKFIVTCDGNEIEKRKHEIFGEKDHSKEIIEIEGSVANKGRITARAFVTMSAAEAKTMKDGEILVTSMTSPDFIIAIKKAAAIVTNEGGILCHAAIVSREFGIPCIVGTKLATQLIKTGDLVEVDGNHGFVRVIRK